MGDHGSRLTDFNQKNSFSSDHLVILRPISIKCDMCGDINHNLSPLKYWYVGQSAEDYTRRLRNTPKKKLFIFNIFWLKNLAKYVYFMKS